MKRKRLWGAVLACLLFVMSAAIASDRFAATAAEESGHVLFEETFDTLSETDFAQKFTQLGDENSGVAVLEAGGVTENGKVLKIERWAAVETEVSLAGKEEFTISAWVRAASSESRLFGVLHERSGAYYLKGGAIANDDHSVLAWCNTDGAAVANNNPQFDGIYEKNGEGYYAITVTVTRQCIKFYKNGWLIDSYYTCNDRATGDVKKFIAAFYEGLQNNRILLGGGAFFTDMLQPYYIDELRIYDYAAESYNDVCAVLAVNKENLLPQYAAIVDAAAVSAPAMEKAPVLFYDFSETDGDTVRNGGSKQNADAALCGEWTIRDGELHLDGNGYMELPLDPLASSEGDFTVSMDIRRATTWNPDAFYWFAPTVNGNAPRGMNFTDCWFKTKSDDPVPRDISWIITDYCDESGNNPHWNYLLTTPDTNEFTLTNVYCDGVLRVYVNGHCVSTQTVVGGIRPNEFTRGFIGLGFWDRANFRGTLDNVAIYDYAVETGTLTSIANRLQAYVDLDADESDENIVADRFYYAYDRFSEHGQNPASCLDSVHIDFTDKHTQVFALREGVTLTVYFRDLIDAEESVTYTPFDALPDERTFVYSDGSCEKLRVRWDQPYAFGTLARYTGTATDAVGRQSRVTYTVTYAGGKDDLAELLAGVESVLRYAPLYPADEFAAYADAVRAAYGQAKTVYEKENASGEEVLQALSELLAVTENTPVPARRSDLRLFSHAVRVGDSVTVSGAHADTVFVSPTGLCLTVYDSTRPAQAVSFDTALEGEYTLKIVRDTAAGRNTAVIGAYLLRDGVIAAQIENAVSENAGPVKVQNAISADLSLLSFYTGIRRKDYTAASLAEYDAILSEHAVGTSVTDWLAYTQADATSAAEFAEAAYERLAFTRIRSAAELTEIRCKVGTDISSLLPSTVTVTYDNESKAALKVVWDMSSLDLQTAGEYTLAGSVAEKDGGVYAVTLKITVEAEKSPAENGGGCGGSACVTASVALPAACVLLFGAVLAFATRRKIRAKNKK